MSKYDQLNYLTFSEINNKGFPKCITDLENENPVIPEELFGVNVENFKNNLKIENDKDESNFQFINNNQNLVNENYLEKCKIFSDKMDIDEKREFLLDYMSYHFGNIVNGKYFETHLQEIFDLKKYQLIDEDFDVMISDYFEKNEVDLNDPEDRKKFKKIMFHQHIKFLNEERAKELLEKREKISEESASKESNISN